MHFLSSRGTRILNPGYEGSTPFIQTICFTWKRSFLVLVRSLSNIQQSAHVWFNALATFASPLKKDNENKASETIQTVPNVHNTNFLTLTIILRENRAVINPFKSMKVHYVVDNIVCRLSLNQVSGLTVAFGLGKYNHTHTYTHTHMYI